MADCYNCGRDVRLRRLWALDYDSWMQSPGDQFVTAQHTTHAHFCRKCIRTFSKCLYCGETAAWVLEPDDTEHERAVRAVCVDPNKLCWPTYWDDMLRTAQEQPHQDRTAIDRWAQLIRDKHEVDSFEQLWPGDGSDPTAEDDSASSSDDNAAGSEEEHECHSCNASLTASNAATFHGNDNMYCLACFKQHLLEGAFD